MNSPLPHLALSGAAMDTVKQPRNRHRLTIVVAITLLVLTIAFCLWRWMPQGLQVNASDVRIAVVNRGIFQDDVVVRANATALDSVILDSLESGRVEEVFARDGNLVARGAPLFRLSNSQRQLELLARQSDQATQISNLSNLRAALEASITDHERRLSDLEFNLSQSEKKYARDEQLATKGFISGAALEEASDQLEQHRHALNQERIRGQAEMTIKQTGLTQMEQAQARLEAGLNLMSATIDALTVRAPVAGRLTDFHLRVGEAVLSGQHFGRIDDPAHFKLSADADEYYLNRITPGRPGKTQINGQSFAVEVTRVYPQIDKGRFKMDIVFTAEQPQLLNPGQNVDTQITLGNPTPALLLPAGAFSNDGGDASVFVLSADDSTAERRAIRIGRRNNSQVEILGGLNVAEKVIVSEYSGFGHAVILQLIK